MVLSTGLIQALYHCTYTHYDATTTTGAASVGVGIVIDRDRRKTVRSDKVELPFQYYKERHFPIQQLPHDAIDVWKKK